MSVLAIVFFVLFVFHNARTLHAAPPTNTPSPTFPITNGSLLASALSPDGSTLYVGGNFGYIGPNTGGGVPVSAATGTRNSTFPIFNNAVRTVIPDGSGGWYVGGDFTLAGAITRNHLAHVLADGTLDSAWDPNITGTSVRALVLTGTTLYIAGDFTTVNGSTTRNNLAAISTTTGTATAWDPNASNGVSAIALTGDGLTLYVGGSFLTVNGSTTRNHLAAISTATGTATAWDPNVGGTVLTIALSGDNSTVYIGGSFATVNGATTRNRIAAFDTTTGTATAWDPNVGTVQVSAIAVSADSSTLYAVGDFTTVNGATTRNRIAAFDTTTGTATAWDPNLSGEGDALVLSGTTLFVGGIFTTVNGATTRNFAAAFDTTTGTATAFNPNPNASLSAINVSGSTVFIGGGFISVNGASRSRIAAVTVATGAVTAWDPNIGVTQVNAIVVSPDGNTVYVGGQFTTVNGSTTRNRIAAFSASTGTATAWDPNIGTVAVNSLALSNDGSTLYVGGSFTTVNGATTRNRLAAISTSTGTATAWDPNIGSTVNWITLSSDGSTLYVGGSFTTVNGSTTRNRIAAFSTSTGTATAWDPNITSGLVNAMALSGDGSTLYAGGTFTTVNGATTRNRIAAFDTTTGTATAWDPNASSTVNTVAVSGSTVYAGGTFGTIGGQTRTDLGAVDATTGLATSWNPGTYNGAVRDIRLTGELIIISGQFTVVNSLPQRSLAAYSSPTVQFSASTSSGAESVASPTLTVSLSQASGYDVTVNYAVTGGTATGGGVDYTLASGTATITAGSTSTTVPLTIVNDSTDESDETVIVTLSSPVNATLGSPSSHTYTILDDDPASTPSVTPPPAGSSGSVNLGVSVTDLVTRVKAGDSPKYRITVTNTGTATATGVRLSASVPKQTTFRLSEDGGTASGTNVSWPEFTLAAGASTTREFRLWVTGPVAAGIETITQNVSVTDDGTHGSDTSAANNSASDTDSVIAQPNLAVSIHGGDSTPTPGSTVSFTLAYANTGNQDASDVIAHIVVPDHTTFASATPGSRWSCDPDTSAGSTCVFPLGTVTAGSGGSLPFSLVIDSDFPSSSQLSVFARLTGTNAPEASTAPVVTTGTYTVVRGDSLWSIAQHFFGDGRLWGSIVDANRERFPSLRTNPSLIQVGWLLLLPLL